MTRRHVWVGVCVVAVLAWCGCVKNIPRPVPVVKPPPAPVSPVVGVWENSVRGTSRGQVIFKDNGQLTFQGGLEFYNPGRWDCDPVRQELVITLPNAEDDKLQIFKMYVGDGVKAFDRVGKHITYHFDDQTTTLNIAGWMFSKVNTTHIDINAEPTLR